MTVRASLDTGTGPHGVVIDPTGVRAWVTNTYDNTVSVVDLTALSVSPALPVGQGPSGISFSPRPPTAVGAPTATLTIPAPSTPASSQTSSSAPNGHGHH